jgi:hypothetical protein
MQMKFIQAEESDIIGKENDYLLVNPKNLSFTGHKDRKILNRMLQLRSLKDEYPGDRPVPERSRGERPVPERSRRAVTEIRMTTGP